MINALCETPLIEKILSLRVLILLGGVTNPLRKTKQASLQMQVGKRPKSNVKG
jgi:hypothetical protein